MLSKLNTKAFIFYSIRDSVNLSMASKPLTLVLTFELLEIQTSHLAAYSNNETLPNSTKINDLATLMKTFKVKWLFWTLLPPGAFMFSQTHLV